MSKNVEKVETNKISFIFPVINLIIFFVSIFVLCSVWNFNFWSILSILDNKEFWIALFTYSFLYNISFFIKIMDREGYEEFKKEIYDYWGQVFVFKIIIFIFFFLVFASIYSKFFWNLSISISWEKYIKEKYSHIEKKINEENKVNPNIEREKKYAEEMIYMLNELKGRTNNQETINEINSEIERLKNILID